jgi:hypothetical protein
MDKVKKAGICANCGSANIEYTDTDFCFNNLFYQYFCNDCENSGEEIYELTFIENITR